MFFNSIIIASLLACTPSVFAKKKKDDATLLSKVKTITLRDGAFTSHRRVEAIPQLNCVGGSGRGLYNVDVMRCHNSGAEYDDEDIQWTCKADLPAEFKLGSTDVICEGYDSPDDPYILKGSCGVEYRLILTPQGEQKYRDYVTQDSWRSRKGDHRDSTTSGTGSDRLAAIIFWVFFGAIVLVIIYSVFSSGNTRTNGGVRRGGFGGGGGGGYDDGHDDPPPPYTPRAPNTKSQRSPGFASSSRQQQNNSWRPGFWTGTATGAAAGYAAGAYANRQQTRNAARPASSNWFGGTNAGPSGGYPGPRFAGGSSSSSPPAPSSSRSESTGFGGTSRR